MKHAKCKSENICHKYDVCWSHEFINMTGKNTTGLTNLQIETALNSKLADETGRTAFVLSQLIIYV